MRPNTRSTHPAYVSLVVVESPPRQQDDDMHQNGKPTASFRKAFQEREVVAAKIVRAAIIVLNDDVLVPVPSLTVQYCVQ